MKDYALITGANSGIGAAIAEELAGAGYTVLLNYYRNQDAAEALKHRIEAAGGNAELAPFDVTDRQATATDNETGGRVESKRSFRSDP